MDKFVVDNVAVQITVAQMQDGRKVGEWAFDPVKLYYPFNLDALLEQAARDAEKAAGAPRV